MRNLIRLSTAILLFSFVMLISCNKKISSGTNQTKSNSSTTKPINAIAKERVFEIGITDYRIVDSLKVNDEMAKFMVDMMRPKMDGLIYVTGNTYSELRENEDNSDRILSVYNSSNMKYQEIADEGDTKYYYKSNMSEKIGSMAASPQEVEEMKKLVSVEELIIGKYNFFGYNCRKVEMYNPDKSGETFVTAYTTNEVPYISQSMGPIGELIGGGMPVKMEMNIEGLIIVSGIKKELNLEEHKSKFVFDLSEYEEISEDAFRAKLKR